VGHATAERLHALNVGTVGALRAFSREHLVALFGVRGEALHERAHGRDSRVVHESEVPRSISRESALHEPSADPEEHRAMLYYLTERAARTMRGLGLAARTVSVKVRYTDDVNEESRRTSPEGVATDAKLFETGCDLLERVKTRRVALHLVGMALSNFVVEGGEQLDWTLGARAPHARDLCEGLDDVRSRYGHAAVIAGPSIDLLGKLKRDAHGFVLRTPSLTK
jgi:DNA polymerase-4